MKQVCRLTVWLVLMAIGGAALANGQTQQESRKIGTVKSVTGNALVLKPDSGADINVTIAGGIRILRLAPGQTDLKSATPVTLNEIQVGDRILVRGKRSEERRVGKECGSRWSACHLK